MKETLKLGIIGAGWMADLACTEIVKLNCIELVGVCARHLDRAKSFAEKFNISFAADSVEELLRWKEIEAVYIATLNDTHFELASKAIIAGKSVIIEKPFTMNAQEAKELISLAKKHGVFLMEAMWTRFFPSFAYIKLLVESGAIGTLQTAEVNTCLKMDRKANARVFMKEHGGGVLVDIGVYVVSFIQMLTGQRPLEVSNRIDFADTQVDMADQIVLRYENGFEANICVTGLEELPPVGIVRGSKGSIEFEAGLMSGKFVLKRDGKQQFFDMAPERFRYPYYYQFEHFARCVREGRLESDRIPLEDTAQVMEIMDQARHAGGFWYPGEV